jgi:hypothetical protein
MSDALSREEHPFIKPGVSPDERQNRLRQGGGDIPHKTRDRLIPISIGRFAGFVHFVLFVVQTPTA